MSQFPKDFLWGVATSSYQIEGANQKGGRGRCIWDAFSKKPGAILDGSSGAVACDHYHRYVDDIKMIAALGVKAYRFSIAWPRIVPNGVGGVNEEGIAFYNRLIDCMLEHGLEPWATLYHWDLPDRLEQEHGGWLCRDIVTHFANYAEVCFDHFGDRVKNWTTLNEPWCSAWLGYGTGHHAPGIVSPTAAYEAGHHLLLAHSAAVAAYRSHPASADGRIGITLNSPWYEPKEDSDAGVEEAKQALNFFLGWFAHPIYCGDYPAAMRTHLGDVLPSFSAAELDGLLGSSDFLGINHYNTNVVSNLDLKRDIEHDKASVPYDCGHRDEWALTAMGWAIVPSGCQRLLEHAYETYGKPPIYITENGCAVDEPTLTDSLQDDARIAYYDGYISACGAALENGVDLRGYFAWTLMDNFEWAFGYERRFGLVHVDHQTMTRTLKKSAKWYRELVTSNRVPAAAMEVEACV